MTFLFVQRVNNYVVGPEPFSVFWLSYCKIPCFQYCIIKLGIPYLRTFLALLLFLISLFSLKLSNFVKSGSQCTSDLDPTFALLKPEHMDFKFQIMFFWDVNRMWFHMSTSVLEDPAAVVLWVEESLAIYQNYTASHPRRS